MYTEERVLVRRRSESSRKPVSTYNLSILSGTALHTPTKYLDKHLAQVTLPTKTKESNRVSEPTPKLKKLSRPSSPAVVMPRLSVTPLSTKASQDTTSQAVGGRSGGGKERPYACGVCGKSYTSSWGLTNHLQTMSECRAGAHERPHCKVCGYHYKEKANLEWHQQNTPNCNPKYVPLRRTVSRGTAVRKVIKPSVSKSIHQQYRCNTCGKSHSSSQSLKWHRRHPSNCTGLKVSTTMETKEKYLCEMCGQSYKSHPDFKYHLEHAPNCNPDLRMDSPSVPPHLKPGVFPLSIPGHSSYLRNAWRDLKNKTGAEQLASIAGFEYCLDSLDVKIQKVWGRLLLKVNAYDQEHAVDKGKENVPEDGGDMEESGLFADTAAHGKNMPMTGADAEIYTPKTVLEKLETRRKTLQSLIPQQSSSKIISPDMPISLHKRKRDDRNETDEIDLKGQRSSYGGDRAPFIPSNLRAVSSSFTFSSHNIPVSDPRIYPERRQPYTKPPQVIPKEGDPPVDKHVGSGGSIGPVIPNGLQALGSSFTSISGKISLQNGPLSLEKPHVPEQPLQAISKERVSPSTKRRKLEIFDLGPESDAEEHPDGIVSQETKKLQSPASRSPDSGTHPKNTPS